MTARPILKTATAVVLTGWCTAALAHSGATGIVAERMEAMKDIAAQMKTLGTMLKGEREWDSETAASAASTIAGHAAEIPRQFPDGSVQPPSEARPAIWKDWDGFTETAQALESAAAALAETAWAAEDAAAIRPAFAAVGGTCSACHEDFRKAD